MNVILLFDQTQAGLGGKENPLLPLGGKNMGIGAYNMLEPFLKKNNQQVVATLYCGDGFYANNPTEVMKKIAAMVRKINPDVVIAGPSYNYDGYAKMCAEVGIFIENKLNIPVITAMSTECSDVISDNKNKITIVKMPKKGGTGLTESLSNICQLAKLKGTHENIDEFTKSHCY